MSASVFSPVIAAESQEETTGGCVIEEATAENLEGEYGAAYEAAGYQATLLMLQTRKTILPKSKYLEISNGLQMSWQKNLWVPIILRQSVFKRI